MADWAKLLQDLLIEIVERLPSMESFLRSAGVCRSWHAAAAAAKSIRLSQTCFESPWLMLAENDEQKESGMREFCCLSLGNKTRKIFLPEASKKRCLSCKDWLLVVDEDEIHTRLLHPLTRVKIPLPRLDTLPGYDDYISGTMGGDMHFIEKVVLTANPSFNSDFIVVVSCGTCKRLGFCKPGDASWTPLLGWVGFEDIIYCNNKLYALNWDYSIIISDIDGSNPAHLTIAGPKGPYNMSYLVHFSGNFFIVHRILDDEDEPEEGYRTKYVKVFEVNIEDGTYLEIKNLGNKTLFLGYNFSFCIEGSECNNIKGNCIYFSDDVKEYYLSDGYISDGAGGKYISDGAGGKYIRDGAGGGKDTFIYHLSDERIEPLFDNIVCSMVAPPIWIGPTF